MIWIPKRMIETWLLFLSGEAVAEASHDDEKARKEAKRKAEGVNIKTAADKFVELFRRWNRNEPIPALLPSLEAAFQETKDRLPFA